VYWLILIGTLATAGAFVAGVQNLVAVAASRRAVVAAVVGEDAFRGQPLIERYDRIFRQTRLGKRLESELVLAGVTRRPIVVFAAGAVVAVLTATLMWKLLAPLFGVLGVTAGLIAVRAYLARERSRRLDSFVAQMPELARVLANATSAGLSINTAVAVAAAELAEPARTELQRVSERVSFGAPLEAALTELHDRLDSREVAVLTSTLVVSARSGGSLVSALRDIANTLETRKETRREIKTTLAQALSTGYLVIGLGFVILIAINTLYPGTVEEMTRKPIGQGALLIAGTLFGGGFFAIRRMTRIDL
jgi:tight adherence protein B